MSKVIVYVDDAAHARLQLARQFHRFSDARQVHWVVVACPVPTGNRIDRRTREAQRSRWSREVSDHIAPLLRARGDTVSTVFASDALDERTRELLSRDETSQVLDARRFPVARNAQPASFESKSPWLVLGAVGGMAAAALLMTG